MVSLFGEADKPILNAAIVIGAVLIAAALGVAARRRWAIGVIGFMVAGGVGLRRRAAPATDRPGAGRGHRGRGRRRALGAPAAARAGCCALTRARLGDRHGRTVRRPATGAHDARLGPPPLPDARRGCRRGRASWRAWSAGTCSRASAAGPQVGDVLPPVDRGCAEPPSLPAGSSLPVEGITPIVVPTEEFYRIDTALVVPRVDAATWSLTVTGMVDTRGVADLRAAPGDAPVRPVRDHRVRLERGRRQPRGQRPVDRRPAARRAGHGGCPGRRHPDRGPLGGRLHGRLPDRVGDGPVPRADDRPGHERRAAARGRTATRRGSSSPACTATSAPPSGWSEIELTTWEAFDGYWVPLGWSKEGPDPDPVTHRRAAPATAPSPWAGRRSRAWPGRPTGASTRSRWRSTTGPGCPPPCPKPLSDATWVQWMRRLGRDARPAHHLSVRATDGTGTVQTADEHATRPRRRPRPSHHRGRGDRGLSAPERLDRSAHVLDREDMFDGPGLDRDLWIAAYLPQWSSRAASAPRYALRDGGGLRLRIDIDQEPWCPEWDGGLRVSSLQTGVFAGPSGSAVGQHRFHPDVVVREEQAPQRLHTPRHGIIETRLRASADPRTMVALWMIGYEDRPERSGEICVVEIFGRDIAPGRAAVGMGVHPHHDGRIRDDFDRWALDIDATAPHEYAVVWRPDGLAWYVGRASRAHRGPGHRLPDAADAGYLRVPGAGRAPRPAVRRAARRVRRGLGPDLASGALIARVPRDRYGAQPTLRLRSWSRTGP